MSGATVALSGVTVALMVATACRPKTDAANAATTPAVVQVGQENVTVVSLGDITVGPVISGTLTPQEQATLRAEVSGPVLQTYVDRGQAVKRGQLLARIDATALREAFLSAQSTEHSARVALDNAKRDQERSAALESAGAMAPRDVEATQRAMLAAEATLADAQSRLTPAREAARQHRGSARRSPAW